MRTITNCRSCGSDRLEDVLSLGDQYMSDFREDESKPPKSPLELVVCKACTLAQLRHTASFDAMYGPNYGFKSGISDAIRADLADVVAYALAHNLDAKSWLDIASNDGTLLSNVPKHIHRVGVDPLKQFAEEAKQHADTIIAGFFDAKFFTEQGLSYRSEFDIITSVSMFYDLDDPNEFVAGVKQVLAPEGYWVIQQNYLPTMLENGSVDNLSHEHISYWSLTSLLPLLARHGLEVIDVSLNPINGGCFRTLVTHAGRIRSERSVTKLLDYEQGTVDVANLAIYERFAKRAKVALRELFELVEDIVSRGEKVYIYGASTRGAVIWQAAGLGPEQIPYVVERNPEKVGKYMSAIGVPIISEEEMRENPPEVLLSSLYWLKEDFRKREADYLRNGGRLIFPLPELEVITG